MKIIKGFSCCRRLPVTVRNPSQGSGQVGKEEPHHGTEPEQSWYTKENGNMRDLTDEI